MPTLLIVGIDSDLAEPVIQFGRETGFRVIGTSRRNQKSPSVVDKIYPCDISSQKSIESCVYRISREEEDSFFLSVFSVGTLEPVGLAGEVSISDWNYSLTVNGIGPMNFIQEFIKLRPKAKDAFITYAGSGTNSAPTHFSAYTLAKVMLIKAMEILAAEYPEKVFLSIGTGWMKSKIHNAVLSSTNSPRELRNETIRRFTADEFGNPENLTQFLKTLYLQDASLVSGRNFSLQGDSWQEAQYWRNLINSPEKLKLRRIGCK